MNLSFSMLKRVVGFHECLVCYLERVFVNYILVRGLKTQTSNTMF